MSLLPKVKALLQRCGHQQARCERQIAELERQQKDIDQSLLGLKKQQYEVTQLLHAQRPSDCVLSRAQLFTLLQRQAVLRGQLQQLDFQQTQCLEQRTAVQQQQAAQYEIRAHWLHKQGKYQHWVTQQRRAQRLARLCQEESEVQENTYGRNNKRNTTG